MVPFSAVSVPEYAVPVVPPGNEVVVIARASLITIEREAEVFSGVGVVLSERFTVNVNVPEADGVPLIAPLDEFKLNPAGRAPLLIVHV